MPHGIRAKIVLATGLRMEQVRAWLNRSAPLDYQPQATPMPQTPERQQLEATVETLLLNAKRTASGNLAPGELQRIAKIAGITSPAVRHIATKLVDAA
ncbi:hypothetical protein [Roseobacter sp. MH60115]|uniref:hypothetical protein n=1 Tax=Roseobacter sp. MH60115 TaxID=2785324 RepID=UPI0018A251C2|nr:hypothetical protein [Roseobacter sp. MH60115]